MKRFAFLLAFLMVVTVAACDSATDPTVTTTTTTTVAPATTVPPATTATTTVPPTTSAPTTTAVVTTTTLPGEPIDFGPRAGDQLAVVGVQFDDVLNLRAAPGTNQTILAGLAPDYMRMMAEGNTRMLPNSFWYEVDADGTVGWVSARFVAYIGQTADDTSRVVSAIGEIPAAPTMLELAGVVVDVLKSQEEPESRITVTKAPTVGDLGEVTVDIIGFGDDALFGLRVVIFAQQSDDGSTFSLMAVESTALCGRGVADGLCV